MEKTINLLELKSALSLQWKAAKSAIGTKLAFKFLLREFRQTRN